MDDLMRDIARQFCQRVDWNRPELADTAFAEAYHRGDVEAAALGFIAHLRRRQRPLMGYTAEYVEQVRRRATSAFREEAQQTVRRLMEEPFLGRELNLVRGTLLGARPEVLQLAAGRDDFLGYARTVAEGRGIWGRCAWNTVAHIVRYLQAVWPLEECPDEALVSIFAFLAAQLDGEWAWARNWGESMLGNSGHNWWAAEFGGLWKAGLFFPELKGFEQFQAFFPTFFEREIRLLMAPDGFSRECSVSYHCGTTDLFLDVVRIARINGLNFSPSFEERLRACGEVEWKLLTPDGTIPAFGDGHSTKGYLFERMRPLAAMLGIPQAKYLAQTMDAGWQSPCRGMIINSLHYPSVGENLLPACERLEARPPAAPDTCLPDSGYYVMRQDWTNSSDYAAIEASTRGNLVTSHGHGAIFSLILYSRGRPILVGNGKGPDDSSPERIWRVRSLSHSVATVDGEDHVPLRSIYRFDRVVVPVVDEWITQKDFAYFSGAHEAYERLQEKVPGSRRKLFYLRGEYWVLIDRFTAAGKDDVHTYRQHFQVGVPLRLEHGGRAVTEGEGGNLLLVPVEGARGEASVEPCPFPLEGYPNPTQLTYTQQRRGHALFVSLLVPFRGDAVPQAQARLLDVEADGRTLSPWEATGLEIVIDGQRDLHVDLHMQWNLHWRCGGREENRRLFNSRCMS